MTTKPPTGHNRLQPVDTANSEAFHFRLSKPLRRRLDKTAKRLDQSAGETARQCFDNWLDSDSPRRKGGQ